jgi:hypothetical protein
MEPIACHALDLALELPTPRQSRLRDDLRDFLDVTGVILGRAKQSFLLNFESEGAHHF